MSQPKHTAILLLVLIILPILCLTSCKKTSSTTENPFAVDGTHPVGSEQSNADPNTGWMQGSVTGEKRLYGKEESSDSSILRFGEMLIGITNYSNCYGYFSFDEPADAKLICFDPLCLHLPQQESCPAVTNLYLPDEITGVEYPNGMYIDLYESTESPVIYFYYRRDGIYSINLEEIGHRDPVYCIERYDLAQGKRYAVVDNVKNTILQACNYADYVYYVLDMGDEKGQELYRVHKSGGESEMLNCEKQAESIRIADVVDDMLYYIVNERYIYRSNLELTESEMVLDMSEIKGKNGSNGVVEGLYSGYLYYFADVEIVRIGSSEESHSTRKGNLYRIPINNLAENPEMIVQGMICMWDSYKFTEKTLYYEPCVFQIDNSEGGETAINTCDGKLLALDLKSGESTTIVENSGMTIYPIYAWDDMVVFSGWAYNSSGVKNSGGNSNLLVAYTSGTPYEIWCKNGALGAVTKEYAESLQEIASAAREAYEASKNAS